ncbi:MAG: amidase [Rhodobacteraceae bacterium]|nr:amidase [Paracoccaceae bacterium]
MDILFQNASDLAAQIAVGTLDPRDLMSATYDRIQAVNGEVNAIIELLPREDAIARAGAAADGLLAGLPIAVKDLSNARGFPTSMGSPLFAGQGPAQAEDLFVERLRQAGAVFIGKTNTPEFGLGSHTYNPVHGITGNAYDPSRSAGGSSGGATVALATGMVPLADGSDMMGSLRNPAGWSNTYGLRPTFGLVPLEPKGDTFLHQLATAGPMARSPEDIELMLQVMAGPDPRQPHGRHIAPRGAAPKRIGWLGDWSGAYPTERGVLEVCEGALKVLEELGCSVEPVQAPFDRDALWEAWTTLRSWMVAGSLGPAMADPKLRALLKPEAVWEAERGLGFSAMDVHRASVIRSDWYARAGELFEEYDSLIMPTAQCFPFAAELDWPKEIGGVAMDTYHRWMEITVPVNILGLPSLAMPAGFSAIGLPMGIQLIGPRDADLSLIDLAKRYHEAAPWIAKRPSLVPAPPAS